MGIIVGNTDWIGAMRRNPLARALRVDKLTLAALEATLALYRGPAHAVATIPVLRMLTTPVAALEARATRLVAMLAALGAPAGAASLARTEATVGGGAFPGARIPSAAVALAVPSAELFEAKLRAGAVPVVARIAEGKVVLDLRGVSAGLDDELCALVASAFA